MTGFGRCTVTANVCSTSDTLHFHAQNCQGRVFSQEPRAPGFHCSFRKAAFDVARRMAVVAKRFPAAPIGDRGDWGSIESVR